MDGSLTRQSTEHAVPSSPKGIIESDTLQMAPRSERDSPGSTITAALLAICALAAALRFATLDLQSFDFDESFTVGIVLNGSLGHALHTIPITESSPPLYYILAWFWTRAFGLGAVGIRSFSALVGTAVVPVAFFIGRRLGSHRAALIAALLVALNPLMVWYSQEARTYALLVLFSALSFWAFVRALDRPERDRLAVWAAASSAAILSHYFAGFLVATEAVWLVFATRRRGEIFASVAVAAVGAAMIPLVISQADNRTQWIEHMSLQSRIKEVVKKWVTGEISPTRNWQLALVALLVGASIVYAARRLTRHERRGVVLAVGAGGAAVLIPLVLDLAGLHYLISKNVMPALTVLLIGVGVILGADKARSAGIAGAAVASAFFLFLTLDDAIDPALQRPDYQAAAKALGAPAREQVVVTPNLGNEPLALYRPGAAPTPSGGWTTRQIVVVQPLPRADVSRHRPPTPAAPPGFVFEGRRDAPTYTLICFSSRVPQLTGPTSLLALAPGAGASAQVWPQALATTGGATNLCAPLH